MRSLVTLASVVLLVLVGQASAQTPRLVDYPHLRCSACHAMIDYIGGRMNETAKVKESVKVSMRFAKGDKRWVDYESSEVRAIEIIDETCKELENKYPLKMDKDSGLRTFSKEGGLRAPEYYTKQDKLALKDSNKQLKETCLDILEEQDDALAKLIMKERQLDELDTKFCKKTAKACGTAKVDKAIKKEMARKKKFESREKKRKAKIDKEAEKKAKEEEEAQAKRDEEEAKRDEEESENEKRLLDEEPVDPALGQGSPDPAAGNPAADLASKLVGNLEETINEAAEQGDL